jgi:hypothetical protein
MEVSKDHTVPRKSIVDVAVCVASLLTQSKAAPTGTPCEGFHCD